MKKIAIIEDDQHIGDILEKTLKKEGFEPVRAYSGTEALYLLEKDTPDLILLDLMLPGRRTGNAIRGMGIRSKRQGNDDFPYGETAQRS